MLNLTSNEIKTLTKTIRNKFTFNGLFSLMSNIITDKNIQESVKKAIGNKGDKKIKQSVAEEFVAELLGSRNYNTLLNSAENVKSYDNNELLNKLELIKKTILNSNEFDFYTETILPNFQKNLNRYFANNTKHIDSLYKLIKKGSTEWIALNSLIDFNKSKIKSVDIVEIDSSDEDYTCYIKNEYSILFEDGNILVFSAYLNMSGLEGDIENIDLNESSIDSDNHLNSLITDELFTDQNDDFLCDLIYEFLESFVSTYHGEISSKASKLSEPDRIKLSTLLKDF